MTNEQFNVWWSAFTAQFPDVGIWVSGLPNGPDVLASWRDMLAAVALEDATDVTAAMSSGRIDPIGTTDNERGGTGRRFAREACLFASERWQRERIATATCADTSERRYHCHLCRDTGLVTIVNPAAWRTRRIVADNMSVRCTCPQAEPYAKERTGSGGTKYRPLVAYDRNRHFRAMDGVTAGSAAEFRQWVADEARIEAAYQSHMKAAEWDEVFSGGG